MHKRFTIGVACPCLVLFVTQGHLCRAEAGACQESSAANENYKGIIQPNSPFDLSKRYEKLLAVADERRLEELRTHDHDGISLQAAWEDVRRASKHKQGDSKLDSLAMTRFLGFVEGRLRVTPPIWWRRSLLEGKVNGNQTALQLPVGKHRVYKESRAGVYVPSEMSLEEHDGRMRIQVGDEVLEVHRQAIESHCIEPSVYALFTPSMSYVAMHSSVRGPYSLLCVDRRSGDIQYKTSIGGGAMISYAFFPVRPDRRTGDHAVEIRMSNDRLLVFGCEESSAYIEGFNIADGANTFRFSTSYLRVKR